MGRRIVHPHGCDAEGISKSKGPGYSVIKRAVSRRRRERADSVDHIGVYGILGHGRARWAGLRVRGPRRAQPPSSAAKEIHAFKDRVEKVNQGTKLIDMSEAGPGQLDKRRAASPSRNGRVRPLTMAKWEEF